MPSLEHVNIHEYEMLSLAANLNVFMYRTRTAQSVGGSRAPSFRVKHEGRSTSKETFQFWEPAVPTLDSPTHIPSDTDSPPTFVDLSDTNHTSMTQADVPVPPQLVRAMSDVAPRHATRKPTAHRDRQVVIDVPDEVSTTASVSEALPNHKIGETTGRGQLLDSSSTVPLCETLAVQCVCCQGDFQVAKGSNEEFCGDCIGRGCAEPRPGGPIAAVRWRWNCQRRRRNELGLSLNPDSPMSGSRRMSQSTGPPSPANRRSQSRASLDAASPTRSPSRQRPSNEPTFEEEEAPTKGRAVVTAGGQVTPPRRRTQGEPSSPTSPTKLGSTTPASSPPPAKPSPLLDRRSGQSICL